MTPKTLTHRDYTVGWVCALKEELVSAQVILDAEHSELPIPLTDPNAYTLGSVGTHNIAIAWLPEGDIGNNPAAIVATRMTSTFPSIKFWLMVGVGGGVPPIVRLGDVVIGTPVYDTPGVIQWDLGIALQNDNFRRTGALNKAPDVVRTGIKKLRALHERRGHDAHLVSMLKDIRSRESSHFVSKYLNLDDLEDILFRADYNHNDNPETANDNDKRESIDNDGKDAELDEDGVLNCRYCDRTKTLKRKPRTCNTEIRYGLIVSGNTVVKNAVRRDEINERLGGNVLCFEMEAAGITISHPCLVIRGICDYSDSHKNYQWQPYAALAAAAVAKELLGVITPTQVVDMPLAAELLDEMKEVKHITELNLETTRNIDIKFDLTKLPSVHEAAFNSYVNEGEPLCHPETRNELFAEINNWAVDSRGKCIFWLNGMAGTGKSTISRTIAHDFTSRHQLGASFFFKRNEGDRGNASKFFTTIAAQLIQSFPDLAPYLKKTLETEPAISTKTMNEQFEKLILKPLSEWGHPLKALLVIDALDECENEGHVARILHLLARVQSIESAKLRFFVTSRPELPVRLGFMKIPESHRDFILHDIPEPIIRHDIYVYLRDELPKIRNNCELTLREDIPLNWPTEKNTEALVNMAIPLFIFAATMCRFIGDTWECDPVGKLKKILHYRPFKDLTHREQLERTYVPVLNQLVQGKPTRSEKDHRIQEFRNIVGSIILLMDPLSSVSLAALLGIPETNINQRLRTLHSVLRVPDDPTIPVRLFHLSFRDFLLDSENNQNEFKIDEEETHQKLAFCCLDLLSKTYNLKEDICSLKKPGIHRVDIDRQLIEKCLPAEVQYACRYWTYHLEKGKCRISDQDKIHMFLNQRFLYWVEALSIIGKMSDSINAIATLQNLREANDSLILKSFLHDARRFLLKNREILNIAPLQIYSSAIVFAPETSIIKSRFKDHIPSWLRRLPTAEKAWNSVVQILEGHSDRVYSIAFSPHCNLLASSSEDSIVKLWDIVTGDLQLTLEHSEQVGTLAFSSDGKLLASGSENDKTIKLWDTVTGDVHLTFEGHLRGILSVAFSSNGYLLASGSDDHTIKIWSIITGNLQKTLQGHSREILSVAFSFDGKMLASGSGDSTIKLWDTFTGCLHRTLIGHSGQILSITFSSDDKLLASGSGDDHNTIKLWNAITGDLQQTLKGHSKAVRSIALSSDDKFLASGSDDRTIKIWDITTSNLLQTFRDFSWTIFSIAFLSNDFLIVGCNDGTIKFLDVFASDGQENTQETHKEDMYAIRCLTYSPNGKSLASGDKDGVITLWDPTTNDVQSIIKGRSNDNAAMVFSPDGNLLASGSDSGGVKLYDTRTGKIQRIMVDEMVSSLSFSPDGKLLALGCDDGIIGIRDVITGETQLTIRIVTDVITSVAFSPDGNLLASGTFDDGIMLWGTVTGDLQQSIDVDGTIDKLWFHTEKPYLVTNKGVFRIQGSQKNESLQPRQREHVFLINSWMTWNEENFIWIPPEYRGQTWDHNNKALAIGCPSGRIIYVEIDFPFVNKVKRVLSADDLEDLSDRKRKMVHKE